MCIDAVGLDRLDASQQSNIMPETTMTETMMTERTARTAQIFQSAAKRSTAKQLVTKRSPVAGAVLILHFLGAMIKAAVS